MNKFTIIILLFSSLVHSSIDMKDLPREVPSKGVIYSLSPPSGFESIKVTFNMSGTVDNKIISIEIDTEQALHVIESSQLEIDFAPNLNEIRFHQIGGHKKPEAVYFNVFYGAPQKTKCGMREFEYLQKAIKITIYPNSKPTVESDNSHFLACKRLTGLGNSHAK